MKKSESMLLKKEKIRKRVTFIIYACIAFYSIFMGVFILPLVKHDKIIRGVIGVGTIIFGITMLALRNRICKHYEKKIDSASVE